MKKYSSICFSLIFLMVAQPVFAWGKESINISFDLSAPEPVGEDKYQVIAINTYAMQAFCVDSFKNSVARSLIGRSKKASLLVTLDKIPVLNMSYDDKTSKCTLYEFREKSLNGQLLAGAAKPDHQLSLIYVSEEKIESINNLISTAKTILGSEANLLSAPITDAVLPFLVSAYEQATRSGLDYVVDFDIPGVQNHKSKAILKGAIGDKAPWTLLSFQSLTKDSVLDNLGYGHIMGKTISGGKSPNKVLDERRATEGGAFKAGSLSAITRECKLLSNTYGENLNQHDKQRLLESYLLTNHRSFLTLGMAEACLERSMASPTKDLTFKILADELVEQLSEYDTFFLRSLFNGREDKVLMAGTKFTDKSRELGASTVSEYIALNSSMPLCHTSMTYNEAAFVQIINSKPYYVYVAVDRLYKPSELTEGKGSRIESITVSKDQDSLYSDKDGVSRCLNSELQKNQLAGM
ncbi:hypothetical protein A3218_23470 [Pseudomonas chlororaphis]|uniref:hypothetical protein n=1 Tax=Pseudomonas chlororaphis TaxID=587753 RepID=UPI000789FCB1|nr:hypothetical protein [Pseudomonas chlororaphis]AMS17112.1 hypothetical protein A3218_23470 [Pseudomonas chlororaphis]